MSILTDKVGTRPLDVEAQFETWVPGSNSWSGLRLKRDATTACASGRITEYKAMGAANIRLDTETPWSREAPTKLRGNANPKRIMPDRSLWQWVRRKFRVFW